MSDIGEGARLSLKQRLGNQISSFLMNGCEAAADLALFWAHCPEVLEIRQTLMEQEEHMVGRAVGVSLKELEGKHSLGM